MTDFQTIEGLRNAGLHQILLRDAGVVLQFYEPPKDFGIDTTKHDSSWRQYLIIRHYYPTFEEAVTAEVARIEFADD